MNSPVNFLLESGVSLAFFSLVYVLFLRKETFFRMNRFFLLASIVFSIILPFLKLRVYDPKSVMLAEITVTPYRNLIEAVTIYGSDFSGSIEKAILSTDFVIIAYLTGFSIFLGIFLIRLIQVAMLIRRNPVSVVNGVKFVALSGEFSPFSFLGYVFAGASPEKHEGYDKIIAHEFEHVRQGHSFDVILLEVLTLLQWFNPAVWILRRVIRENHEYLADEAVLNSGISRGQYKNLLINQFVGSQYSIANNFNYSLIKSRIKMMSKLKSPKISAVKVVFGFLIVTGLIIVFACEQKKSADSLPVGDSNAMKIIFNGDSLRIEGSANDLDRVNQMLSSGQFSVSSDSLQSGFLLLSEKTAASAPIPQGEKIFTQVEKMPEFPGGEMALRKFIAGNVNYPDNAKKNGIQGKVFVSFVVAKEGSVKGVKIARGVDPELDREAIRVISLLPAWKPGVNEGVPVNVSYTVPISFVLQ